jgi:DNA mismatch repair protein MutS
VQVAALAGMPPAVVREARRRLALLENREAGSLVQPDLFRHGTAAAGTAHIRHWMHCATCNPDELSPREALEMLYQLGKLARS